MVIETKEHLGGCWRRDASPTISLCEPITRCIQIMLAPSKYALASSTMYRPRLFGKHRCIGIGEIGRIDSKKIEIFMGLFNSFSMCTVTPHTHLARWLLRLVAGGATDQFVLHIISELQMAKLHVSAFGGFYQNLQKELVWKKVHWLDWYNQPTTSFSAGNFPGKLSLVSFSRFWEVSL